MSPLKFTGKTEPPADEALEHLRAAVEDRTVAFAVIDTEKGRTIYANLEPVEARELLEWLMGGVLEGILGDIIRSAAQEGRAH